MFVFKFVYPKFISTNNSKFRPKNSKNTILTNEARKFKNVIQLDANNQAKKAGKLFDNFDPAIHYIEVEYMNYKPNLFTTKGLINQRRGDWDGNLKIVQDAMFKAIGLDDSFILSAKVDHFQSKSDDEVFICIIRICNLNSRFS